MRSVIENEFLAAEKRPVGVFDGEAEFVGLGGLEGVLEFEFLLGGWEAGEGGEENVVDQFGNSFFGVEEFSDAVSFGGQFLIESVAVEDVKDLGDAWLAGAFATAGFFAIRATE